MDSEKVPMFKVIVGAIAVVAVGVIVALIVLTTGGGDSDTPNAPTTTVFWDYGFAWPGGAVPTCLPSEEGKIRTYALNPDRQDLCYQGNWLRGTAKR